jgi:hypothetical protein
MGDLEKNEVWEIKQWKSKIKYNGFLKANMFSKHYNFLNI